MTEKLKKLSGLLWKPLNIEVEQHSRNALLFDINKLNEEEFDEFLKDTFCDGEPDGLDIETKVPFCIIGYINAEGFKEQKLEAIEQPEFMFFADIESGEEGNIPVYSIDIDGTAIESTFKKIADDLNQLDFKPGFI